MKRFLEKWTLWLPPLLATLFFVTLSRVTYFRYENSDDFLIARTFLGFEGMRPVPPHLYLHPALVWVLNALSAAAPGVAWFSVAQLGMLWISAAVLCLCIPAGFSIIMTVATINSLLQALADEDKRGRVMGYLAMTFTGISPLGCMALGYLEKYTRLPAIILLAGIVCILASITFEYYRPLIYKYSGPLLLGKGIKKSSPPAK